MANSSTAYYFINNNVRYLFNKSTIINSCYFCRVWDAGHIYISHQSKINGLLDLKPGIHCGICENCLKLMLNNFDEFKFKFQMDLL